MRKVLCILTAACCLWALWPRAEPEKKYIPVTVASGDTLYSICAELADEYGDERGVMEIIYYAAAQNNIGAYIYPGQKLVIELHIEKKASAEAGTKK